MVLNGEFHLAFWSSLGPLLVEVFKETFCAGELCDYMHGGHASPKKHRVVHNFLSFCSVILKLGTKKELVIP